MQVRAVCNIVDVDAKDIAAACEVIIDDFYQHGIATVTPAIHKLLVGKLRTVLADEKQTYLDVTIVYDTYSRSHTSRISP